MDVLEIPVLLAKLATATNSIRQDQIRELDNILYGTNSQVKKQSGKAKKIVAENTKRRDGMKRESELNHARNIGQQRYYVNSSVFTERFTTKEGKIAALIAFYHNRRNIIEDTFDEKLIKRMYSEICDIYFTLKEFDSDIPILNVENFRACKPENFQQGSILKELEEILVEEYDPLRLQIEGYVYPESNFPMNGFKFDDWQKEVIDEVITKDNDLILVSPTSSGKTFLALLTTFGNIRKGDFVLIIVPIEALAFEIAANYLMNFNEHVSLYTNNYTLTSTKGTIIVGTPYALETAKLDYRRVKRVIYDEIHTLDEDDAYERLLHVLKDKKFLALSATLRDESVDKLRIYFSNLTSREVKVIKVTSRFMNLQRWYVSSDNTLKPLISSDILENLTLKDCVVIAEKINERSLDVYERFDNKSRISMKDIREYEKDLIDYLKLSQLNIDVISPNEDPDIVEICFNLKEKDTLPAVIFRESKVKAFETLELLIKTLESRIPNQWKQDQQDMNEQYREIKEQIRAETRKTLWAQKRTSSKLTYSEIESALWEKEERKGNPTHSTDIHAPPEWLNFSRLFQISSEEYQEIFEYLDSKAEVPLNKKCLVLKAIRFGIGLYSEDLPIEYLIILQRLILERKIGIVITSKELAYGVNLPLKTAILVDEVSPLLCQQMTGRAGRRGIDKHGNVIYLKIIKRKLSILEGKSQILYKSLYDKSLIESMSRLSLKECYVSELPRMIDWKNRNNVNSCAKVFSVLSQIHDNDKELFKLLYEAFFPLDQTLYDNYMNLRIEERNTSETYDLLSNLNMFLKIIRGIDLETSDPMLEVVIDNTEYMLYSKLLEAKYNLLFIPGRRIKEHNDYSDDSSGDLSCESC